VSYVVASYAIVLGSLALYAVVQRRSRDRLRKALQDRGKRDRG
jgi:hypothetical protein